MTTALLALVVFGGTLLVVDRTIHHQMFGFRLIVAVAFLNHALPLPAIEVGGFQVYSTDVLLVILGAALVARTLRGWRPTGSALALCGVALLVVLSTVRGVAEFGVAASINESRVHLFFMAVVLYAISAPPERGREGVARLWLLYATGLMALAILRWAIVFGGLPGRGDWYDTGYGGLRVIKSDETMVVGVAFLLLLPLLLRGEASRWQVVQAVTFGTGALLLQHRSVISMVLIGVLAQLIRNRHTMTPAVVYVAGIASICGAVTFVVLDDGSITEDVQSSEVADSDTFEWRIEGWVVLVEDFTGDGPLVVAAGQPFGWGWDRVIRSGQLITVSPHNMYVELLLRVGVLGLGTFLGLFVLLWTRLRTDAPRPGASMLDDSTLSVLLIAFSIYMIPYRLFMETGILLGLALREVGRARSLPEPTAARPGYGFVTDDEFTESDESRTQRSLT